MGFNSVFKGLTTAPFHKQSC